MAGDDTTRQRILEAAGPLFAERGFDAVTVRDIIAKAGCNLASVNYHFDGKEGLYFEAVRHAAERVACFAPLPVFGPGTSAEERLRLFIAAFVRRVLAEDGPSWQRTLIHREIGEPRAGACEELVRHFIRPTFEMLKGIVAELAPRGTPDDRLDLMSGSILGQVLHNHHCRHVIGFLLAAQGKTRQASEALADHIFRFSLAALRHYPKKGGA